MDAIFEDSNSQGSDAPESGVCPNKKQRRNSNFSEDEKTTIINFVKDNKSRLLGKAGRPGHGDDKVEERKAKAWMACTIAVNQVGGNGRDWKKVKKQWQALQDRAKKTKESRQRTGGGPGPKITPVIALAMEVMARESLEGVRGVGAELDPLGQKEPEFSQDSSQESEPIVVASRSKPAASTIVSTACKASGSRLPSSVSTAAANKVPSPEAFAVLQQRVERLEAQVRTLSAPTALQKATEIRHLKYQEELMKLEKTKVELQSQSVALQKKMVQALESAGANALFSSMTEQ